MDQTTARRAVLGSLIAGGAVATAGAVSAEAAAGFTPRELPARKLSPGDLIVGPGGRVVRVASRKRLASGRHRIRYTDPSTGDPAPISPTTDESGYPGNQRFVVLLRDVGVRAVTLAPGSQVVDGGQP